jgi:hypothetical protein
LRGQTVRYPTCVNENELRRLRECFDGASHREQARNVDVHAIDLVDLGASDCPAHCILLDLYREFLTASLFEDLLGVIETAKAIVAWKNHGTGDYRTRERSHSCFINAGDVNEPFLPELTLVLEEVTKPLSLGSIAGIARAKLLCEVPSTTARVILEC